MNLRADDTFAEDEGWQMTAANPKATYICLNYGQAAAPTEIQRQSICIDGNIGEILQ